MPPFGQRLFRYVSAQRSRFHFRLVLLRMIDFAIPRDTFGHLRAMVYGWMGFEVAPRARLLGPLTLRGTGDIYSRLTIGTSSVLNSPASIELNAPVRIGARCGLGHHLMLITTNHEIGPSDARCGPPILAGITIEDGAFVAACVTILPGVTIGKGAFVATGAVVVRDVPPNARVAGNPAVVVGMMTDEAPVVNHDRAALFRARFK